MTRVTKRSLNKNNKNLQKLDTISSNISNIKSTISTFIEGSKNKLTGPGYDAVRAKLDYYVTILNNEENLCRIVKSNYISANNSMLEYMEDFDELDTSELESVRKNINWAHTQMNNLSLELAKLIEEDTSSRVLNNIRKTLTNYSNTYEYNVKLKTKLEGLEEADEALASKISNTTLDCKNMNKAINEIK